MAANPQLPEPCAGYSSLGRPLPVRFYGSPGAELRILLVGGQHGDERGVRRALSRFEAAAAAIAQASGVQLAILPDVNPDGAAARTRNNALGIDLNRDHVLLQAPETEALHRFARHWAPDLVVDLHNYPSRRKHWVERGLRLGWDVALDFPTHPAAPLASGHWLLDTLEEALRQVSRKQGFRYGRYGLQDADGSFRHGTPRLGDARNTLSLRLDAPVLLLEARNPGRSDPPADKQKVRAAVVTVLEQIVTWASVFVSQWNSLMRTPSQPVPLAYRRRADGVATLPLNELATGDPTESPALRYRPIVQPRRRRPTPHGYWVPNGSQTLNLLCRHGFTATPARGGWLFPVDQQGGRLLMLLLDPESKSSLASTSGFALDAERWRHRLDEMR